MKFLIALCLFMASAYATTFVEFECPDLPATGIAEIEIDQPKIATAYVWLESKIASSTLNGIELIGKSLRVEAKKQKSYYELKLKPVGDSKIQDIHLLLGHSAELSSSVHFKNGLKYRGKCQVK